MSRFHFAMTAVWVVSFLLSGLAYASISGGGKTSSSSTTVRNFQASHQVFKINESASQEVYHDDAIAIFWDGGKKILGLAIFGWPETGLVGYSCRDNTKQVKADVTPKSKGETLWSGLAHGGHITCIVSSQEDPSYPIYTVEAFNSGADKSLAYVTFIVDKHTPSGAGSDPGQGGEEPPEKWIAAAEDMLKSGNGDGYQKVVEQLKEIVTNEGTPKELADIAAQLVEELNEVFGGKGGGSGEGANWEIAVVEFLDQVMPLIQSGQQPTAIQVQIANALLAEGLDLADNGLLAEHQMGLINILQEITGGP